MTAENAQSTRGPTKLFEKVSAIVLSTGNPPEAGNDRSVQSAKSGAFIRSIGFLQIR